MGWGGGLSSFLETFETEKCMPNILTDRCVPVQIMITLVQKNVVYNFHLVSKLFYFCSIL